MYAITCAWKSARRWTSAAAVDVGFASNAWQTLNADQRVSALKSTGFVKIVWRRLMFGMLATKMWAFGSPLVIVSIVSWNWAR